MCSILLFFGFMVLCAWEVAPKFYKLATRDFGQVLFVAKTKQNDSGVQKNESEKKSKDVDYQNLIEGINTDGA